MADRFMRMKGDVVDPGAATRWTNLDPRQADELRTMCKKEGRPMPRNIAERVRLFYELKGEPVPEAVLAATGRTRDVPYANEEAIELAHKFAINLALIQGTGPGGQITEKDVKEHLRAIYDTIPESAFKPSEQLEAEQKAKPKRGRPKKKAEEPGSPDMEDLLS